MQNYALKYWKHRGPVETEEGLYFDISRGKYKFLLRLHLVLQQIF